MSRRRFFNSSINWFFHLLTGCCCSACMPARYNFNYVYHTFLWRKGTLNIYGLCSGRRDFCKHTTFRFLLAVHCCCLLARLPRVSMPRLSLTTVYNKQLLSRYIGIIKVVRKMVSKSRNSGCRSVEKGFKIFARIFLDRNVLG